MTCLFRFLRLPDAFYKKPIQSLSHPSGCPNIGVHRPCAVLIIAGSNDLLLDKVISLYNTRFSGKIAVFGNLGSMGGLQALRQNYCHIASSHLLQKNGTDYNFEYASQEFDHMPAIVNFCRREQGILVKKGNPQKINSVSDFSRRGIRIVNRPLGTGTRLLLDQELKKASTQGDKIDGYHTEVPRHLDVGLEILASQADAGLGIHAVAGLLHLDFVPLRWERYDLMIYKERFFDTSVQQFLGLLYEDPFIRIAESLKGYDIGICGRILFPESDVKTENKQNEQRR